MTCSRPDQAIQKTIKMAGSPIFSLKIDVQLETKILLKSWLVWFQLIAIPVVI